MFILGKEKKGLNDILESHFENSDEIELLSKKNNHDHLKTKTGRVINSSTTYHLASKKPLTKIDDLNNALISKFFNSNTKKRPINVNPFSISKDRLILGNLVYEEPYKNYSTSDISTIVLFPSIEVYFGIDICDSIKNGIPLNTLKKLHPKSKFGNFLESFISTYSH